IAGTLPIVPKTNGAQIGPKAKHAPRLVHDVDFVDFAGHDEALDAFALEAADHPAQASNSRPVESVHLACQRGIGFTADADADDAVSKSLRLFREKRWKS